MEKQHRSKSPTPLDSFEGAPRGASQAALAARMWSPPMQLQQVKQKSKKHGGKTKITKPQSVGKMPAALLPELMTPVETVPNVLEVDEDSSPLPLESVVKIEVVATPPNYYVPWQMRPQEEYSGSGWVLAGRRILTNAHVVENHSIVHIRRHNDAERYLARVLCIGHSCDLALLTVEDESFWEVSPPPLELAPLPRLYEDVMVVGYPVGGDNISVTRGIVSRIDMMPYVMRAVENSSDLLVVQIDAAINPGNSGGPACNMDGRVVGVAFAGLDRAQSIGYIIPLNVIQHFLQQYERSGKYTGTCELGVELNDMENKTLRRRFKMHAKQTGVLVSDVLPLSCAHGKLQRNDVILSVDGTKIANDGSVLYKDVASRASLRLGMSIIFTSHFAGDKCSMRVLRDGEEKEFEVTLAPLPPLVPSFHLADAFPSYFIVGGLVFSVLSIPLINQVFEDVSEIGEALSALHESIHRPKKQPDEQLVIVLRILIHEVNYGYGVDSMSLVKKVNGKEIKNLKDLIAMVKHNKNEFLEFDIGQNDLVVLDAAECKKAEAQILKQHGIPRCVSDDLADFYDTVQPPADAPTAATATTTHAESESGSKGGVPAGATPENPSAAATAPSPRPRSPKKH